MVYTGFNNTIGDSMIRKILNKIARGYLFKQFKKDKFRKHLIKTLNAAIDIPVLTEKQEAKLLNKIYDSLVKYFSK